MLTQLEGLRKESPNVLFFIARSKNLNIVVYEAKQSNGVLDTSEPVTVYWLDIDPEYRKKARSSGKMDDRVELGMIEKKMAYGVSSTPFDGHPGEFMASLVAFPTRAVRVFIDPTTKKPRAQMQINKQQVDLVRIYVEAKENFIGLPSVVHVDVTGIDANGQLVTERIMPGQK